MSVRVVCGVHGSQFFGGLNLWQFFFFAEFMAIFFWGGSRVNKYNLNNFSMGIIFHIFRNMIWLVETTPPCCNPLLVIYDRENCYPLLMNAHPDSHSPIMNMPLVAPSLHPNFIKLSSPNILKGFVRLAIFCLASI